MEKTIRGRSREHYLVQDKTMMTYEKKLFVKDVKNNIKILTYD